MTALELIAFEQLEKEVENLFKITGEMFLVRNSPEDIESIFRERYHKTHRRIIDLTEALKKQNK